MWFIGIAILLPGLVYAYVQLAEHKSKRKVHSVVHIQCRTEEAETMDFAVTLFQDESPDNRRMKMLEIFEVCEDRRKYNNDRLQQLIKEQQEKMAALKNEG